MTQFISLDDAIKQLGITKDRLNDLREAGIFRAFKDGASWKFRSDEIEKALADPSMLTPPMDSGLELELEDDLELDLIEEPSDPADSILVSDVDGTNDPSRPPSTIIGKGETGKGDSDLELKLDDDGPAGSDVHLASSASDVLSAGASSSNILDEPDDEIPLSISDTPDPSAKFEDLDELEIDLETESSKILSVSEIGKLTSGEDISELDLAESDLQLSGSSIDPQPSDLLEPLGLEDDDDDLVLSDGGSDITLSAGDSGINLIEASDSGIALDDISLELGGSGIEPLDLAESDEQLVLDDGPSDLGNLKAEDSFALTPLSGPADEEESGSQVIALDSAQDIGDSVQSLLGDDMGAVTLEPADGGLGAIGGMGAAVGVSAMSSTSPSSAPTVPDTTFSGMIIGLLILCVLIMAMLGIMMFDLLQNIESWSEPFSFTSQLMEAFGLFK